MENDTLSRNRHGGQALDAALSRASMAAAMAEALESKALDQMTSDASRALRDGMEPRKIIRQMGL
ncbi:hypothetical protein [Pseudomonas putida]|uniref:hypothetical protein n=1 Tax=Pseudomonas putida TaxID=303 RepID=UPI00301E2E25